jgi:hypothetical protein
VVAVLVWGTFALCVGLPALACAYWAIRIFR